MKRIIATVFLALTLAGCAGNYSYSEIKPVDNHAPVGEDTAQSISETHCFYLTWTTSYNRGFLDLATGYHHKRLGIICRSGESK